MDGEFIELPLSPEPRVSIVVVTTVNAAGLERCLRSLPGQASDGLPFETVVVLNGAQDDVRELATRRLRGAKVVESLANRGFAGGSNLGCAAATGELLVLLHDDAEAQEDWLTELVRCADEHPEAGAVGGRVQHPDGTLQLAGAVVWRDGSTTSIGSAHGDFLERRPVDYVGSSSLLVRTATWDAVGGMDDRFYPAYYADADLAMAIRGLGEAVLYEPRSQILHHKGASSTPRFQAFVSARNRELFRRKWARELESQEPPGEGPEALARAFRRTRLEAARFEETSRSRFARQSPAASPPSAALSDSAEADRRFLQMDRELRGALVAQLTAEVEELHAVIRRKDEHLRRQEAALHLASGGSEALAAIESGGWWRLRQRLLPVLRGARAARRAVSRRAAPNRKG
jgi:GT2 family glycosyltransferase